MLSSLALATVVHATPIIRRNAERWFQRALAGRTEAEFAGRTLDHAPCTFRIKNDEAGLVLSVQGLGVKYADASVEFVGSTYVFESGKSLVMLRLDEDADAMVASAQEGLRAVSCVLFQR